jgi:hypothetical protein
MSRPDEGELLVVELQALDWIVVVFLFHRYYRWPFGIGCTSISLIDRQT